MSETINLSKDDGYDEKQNGKSLLARGPRTSGQDGKVDHKVGLTITQRAPPDGPLRSVTANHVSPKNRSWGILQEYAAGAKVSELCRKHGTSDAKLYKWKARYGGMTVSEMRRLKDLEAENAELQRLLTDAMLDNAALQGLLVKNVWSAPRLQVAW